MSEIASKGQLRASFLRWAIVTVPLILLLGFAAGRLAPSGDENGWYVALAKPALTPPGPVFGLVWSVLYVMLGLALAMVVDARGARGRGVAVTLFAAQFVANLSWSPLFFGAHRIGLALVAIGVMLVLGVLTTFAFARIRRVAAWLMLPYLVWISFAGVLLWSILQLNPAADALDPRGSTTQIQL